MTMRYLDDPETTKVGPDDDFAVHDEGAMRAREANRQIPDGNPEDQVTVDVHNKHYPEVVRKLQYIERTPVPVRASQEDSMTVIQHQTPKMEIVFISETVGEGMRAAAPISAGDHLLAEKGMIMDVWNAGYDSLAAAVLLDPWWSKNLSTGSHQHNYHHHQLPSPFLQFSNKAFSRAMAQVGHNTIPVGYHTPGDMTRRRMLTARVCKFNHSCQPNAALVFDDTEFVHIFALTPIEIGEEIRLQYSPHHGHAPPDPDSEAWACNCTCGQSASERSQRYATNIEQAEVYMRNL